MPPRLRRSSSIASATLLHARYLRHFLVFGTVSILEDLAAALGMAGIDDRFPRLPASTRLTVPACC